MRETEFGTTVTGDAKLASSIAAKFISDYKYTSSWSMTIGSKKYKDLAAAKSEIYCQFIQKLRSFQGGLSEVMGIIGEYVDQMVDLRKKYLKKDNSHQYTRELDETELKMVKLVLTTDEETTILDDKTIRGQIKVIYVRRNLQPPKRLEENFLKVFASLKGIPDFKVGEELYKKYNNSLTGFLPTEQEEVRLTGYEIHTSQGTTVTSWAYSQESFEAAYLRAKTVTKKDNIFRTVNSSIEVNETVGLIEKLFI